MSRQSNGKVLSPRSGNSDPFNCHAVPVTPRANQVISFFRFYSARSWSTSFMLQLMRMDSGQIVVPGRDNPVGLAAAASLWTLLTQDTTGFWSVVASMIPLMKRLMPEAPSNELSELGIRMRAHCIKNLRDVLTEYEHASNPPITVPYQVKGLFREACTNGDTESARLHAQMLCKFSEKAVEQGRQDIWSLRMGLWSDAASALLQFRRPVFIAAELMPLTLGTIWRLADRVLMTTTTTTTTEQIHQHSSVPGIPNRDLQNAFLHIRQALHVCDCPITARNAADIYRAEIVFHWANTTAEHHMCRLLNLYFDLVDNQVCNNFPLTDGQRYTEAAVALALLHVLQKSFGDATQSDGTDIHESAATIHPPLKKAFEHAQSRCSDGEKVRFQAVHFWILYVGAFCEERLYIHRSRRLTGTNAHGPEHELQTWFHREMATRALQMGLTSWTHAETVLSQYVFVPLLKPHPQSWYEHTINKYKG